MTLTGNANVEVGESAVEKLVDVATDVFSPATEALGLLGDTVRLARVEVAANIARRAKRIADDNGIKLTAPPLKFLVPFFEKASIEDPTDSDLAEMWAHLLVSAGSDYDARFLRYTSILSEMSAPQARIIQEIMCRNGEIFGKKMDPDDFWFKFRHSNLVDELEEKEIYDGKEFEKIVKTEVFGSGVAVSLAMYFLGRDQHEVKPDDVWINNEVVDFEILRSFGLLGYVATDTFRMGSGDACLCLYFIAEMGYDFWLSCSENPEQ